MSGRVVLPLVASAAACALIAPTSAQASWHALNHPAADNVLHVCKDGVRFQAAGDSAAGGTLLWDDPEFASPSPGIGEPPPADVVARPDLVLDRVPLGFVTAVSGELPDPGSFPLDLRHNFGEFTVRWTYSDGKPRLLAPGATVQLDYFDEESSTPTEVTVRNCLLPAKAPARWAYAWAQDPSPPADQPGYFAAAGYARTSGAIRPVITHRGVGHYEVRLPGAGGSGGVAHVSAYGSGGGTCSTDAWFASGPDLLVDVTCTAPGGAPQNSRFVTTYALPVRGPALAQLLADQPTAASYTPARGYQYNAARGPATVRRTATGAYTVTVPGLGSVADGAAVVTPYAAAGAACSVTGTAAAGTALTVGVRCTGPSGTATDARFSLSYFRGSTWLDPARRGAYAVANLPGSASYAPVRQWSTGGGTSRVQRTATGEYAVDLAGAGTAAGSVLVSPWGTSSARCRVLTWGPLSTSAQRVYVACATPGGAPVDAAFVVAYTS